MRWTYQEYISQPEWYITLLSIKGETEAEYDRNTTPKNAAPKN